MVRKWQRKQCSCLPRKAFQSLRSMISCALALPIVFFPIAVSRRNGISSVLDDLALQENEEGSISPVGECESFLLVMNKSFPLIPLKSPWEADGIISSSREQWNEKTNIDGTCAISNFHDLEDGPCKLPVVVKASLPLDQASCDAAANEIRIMKEKLNFNEDGQSYKPHPHIIRLYDFMPRSKLEDQWDQPRECEKSGIQGKYPNHYLLLEKTEGGDLETAFNKSVGGRKDGWWAQFLNWFGKGKGRRHVAKNKMLKMMLLDFLSGLRHMHKRGVVHRAIKPASLWMASSVSSACVDKFSCRFVIGDLGVAAVASDVQVLGQGGTESKFWPPEKWKAQRAGKLHRWTEKGDVWALGAALLTLFAGAKLRERRTPNFPLNEMRIAIQEKTYIDQKLKDILMLMTEDDPANRPTAEAALKTLELTKPEELGRHESLADFEGKVPIRCWGMVYHGECLNRKSGCKRIFQQKNGNASAESSPQNLQRLRTLPIRG